MKQQTTIVIAALMIASIAFAVSASAVNAAHTQTVEITPTLTTKENIGFEIEVTNTGGDPITDVEVTLPFGFTVVGWVGALMADTPINDITTPSVVLPAGTKISTEADLTLAENTPVTIGKDNEISTGGPITVIVPAGTTIKSDNTFEGNPIVELKYDTKVGGMISLIKPEVELDGTENITLSAGTKIQLGANTKTDLPEGTLAAPIDGKLLETITATLDADTTGKVGPGDITVTLTETGTGKLVEDTDATLSAVTTINLPKDTKVVLSSLDPIDNEENASGQNVTLWKARTIIVGADNTATINDDAELSLSPDYKITATLGADNLVTTPSEETEIVLSAEATAMLPDNTSLWMLMPSGWKAAIDGQIVTWEENNIANSGEIGPGESWTFSIRADIAAEDGEYSWTVKTTDTEGKWMHKTLTTTVDATAPKLEVSMEPYRVGAGPATIKVEADEPLSSLGKVYVELDNDTDKRTLISMTPDAEKKVWTGTVTIPGNGLWDDNKVEIEILAGSLDLAGNNAEDIPENDRIINDPTSWSGRRIDTVPPCLLAGDDLKLTENSPFPENTNQRSQLITGTASDNLDAGDNISHVDNLTVKIRVGTTTYETKSFADGAFTKDIELAEGPNTIKVWVVDRVGNIGPENVQTVFCDSLKPTIGAVSVAGKTYKDNVPINDNTPTVVFTIKDTGYPDTSLGIELDDITVTLEYDAESVELENTAPWDKATGRFEIDIGEYIEAGLSDNFYFISVKATDVMGNKNAETLWFKVDTEAPGAPTIGGAYTIVSEMDSPKVVKDASRIIAGTAEAGADITVYGTVDTTEKVLGTATAGSDNRWTVTFALTAGEKTKIEVSATDEAGNKSASRELYGWMLADASAPTVTLDELSDTTDKASITIKGKVTKDPWEDWSEITLTVQVGTGDVEVPCVGGSYEYSLALSEGPNTIVVQATDGIGNPSDVAHATVERTVTSWGIYAIVLVIVALVMAAIAIFRKKR